jgi:uncharacterized repeat protein (TIGR01451 family)
LLFSTSFDCDSYLPCVNRRAKSVVIGDGGTPLEPILPKEQIVAQQVPRRNDPGHQGGRDNERNANRDADDEDEAEAESASTPAPRRGRQGPVNKLNMYMRAVAVVALLIIGGVGVYKGRNMLAAKDTGPKIAKVKDPTKSEPVDSKPIEVKPGDAKAGESPKPGAFTSNTGSTKNKDPKKPSALLDALNKEKEKKGPALSSDSKTGNDKKPGLSGFKLGGNKKEDKPAGDKPSASGTRFSVSDPVPTVDAGEGYSADPPATDESTGYTGDEGSVAADDGGAEASPRKPASRLGGFSLNDDTAGPADDSAGDQQPPEETDATGPVPPAPSFAANGGFADRAKPPASSTGPNGIGSPLRNTLPDSRATTSPSRLGSITDSGDEPEKSPARLLPNRTVPPNRLTSNPLPSDDSSPAEGYGPDEDVTPITSAAGQGVAANLTGLQTPTIAVEKFAPEEVQVGKPATFEIVVKNVGKVPAYDVTVQDEVPRGTRFRQATPQATQTKAGGLSWKLGVIEPGQEKVIELQLVPEMEGEIGSVAQVTFQSKAGSKSIVTQPKLEIRHEAPQQVHAGEIATVRLTITNSGTGAASNLVLASNVPEGFTHEAGSSLETKVNPLRPGETTQINLVMKAVKAGQYQQAFAVEEEDGKVVAQDAADIEIVAPGLEVAIAGPKKRYVERQATHNITITNPGTASAKDVDLVAYLPRGFKFVSAAPAAAGGQYDSAQHAVIWGLEELVAGASATVQLTTLPVESGDQKVRVEARSANGLTADFEQLVAVDSVSELPFTIHDLADPIEIGSETAYEIRLSNRGAKDATNVAISVAFPRDLKPIDGDGAAKATVSGDRVEFAPIDRITPGQEVVFKVRAEGLRAGDHRIAVSLTSDDQQQPLTREESTRVYSDQ